MTSRRRGPQTSGSHLLLPRLRDSGTRSDRLAGQLAKQVCPRPRHTADEPVPATTERDPPALAELVRQLMQGRVGTALPVDGQRKLGEWVLVMGVAPRLGHQHLRPERPQHRRHDGMERRVPAGIIRVGGQRDVDALPHRVASTGLVREPRSGEQRQWRLVDADRQHPGVTVEGGLYAVAVVHVDVDVGDPLRAELQQPRDGDRRVVEDAEP